jgi:hypothetical protein
MTENGGLYKTHAQGDPIKTEFTLDANNIDEYTRYSIEMQNDIKWLGNIINLQHKLTHLDEVDDELYTEEYLSRRLEKVKTERNMTEEIDRLFKIKEELYYVNKDISVVRPLVFHPEEGKKPEHHERMSILDEKRVNLEEQINTFYGERYPDLKKNLPKIYYMIIDGCDIETVINCFHKMKMVLTNQLTTEQAANSLMNESSTKYNLPQTIWDPIRKK